MDQNIEENYLSLTIFMNVFLFYFFYHQILSILCLLQQKFRSFYQDYVISSEDSKLHLLISLISCFMWLIAQNSKPKNYLLKANTLAKRLICFLTGLFAKYWTAYLSFKGLQVISSVFILNDVTNFLSSSINFSCLEVLRYFVEYFYLDSPFSDIKAFLLIYN